MIKSRSIGVLNIVHQTLVIGFMIIEFDGSIRQIGDRCDIGKENISFLQESSNLAFECPRGWITIDKGRRKDWRGYHPYWKVGTIPIVRRQDWRPLFYLPIFKLRNVGIRKLSPSTKSAILTELVFKARAMARCCSWWLRKLARE